MEAPKGEITFFGKKDWLQDFSKKKGFKLFLYFQPSIWRTPQFALVAAAARLNAHCPKVAGVHRMTKPKMVAAKRQQIL